MPFKQAHIDVDYSVRSLCRRPYPNHPKGCPNYGRQALCPPHREKIEDLINLNTITYVIWSTFNLKKHINKMRKRHPTWTRRQLECCLYWQGTARKQLRHEISLFNSATDPIAGAVFASKGFALVIVQTPEACGVHVTNTMAGLGHHLEWPPKNITYQVAVAGLHKL